MNYLSCTMAARGAALLVRVMDPRSHLTSLLAAVLLPCVCLAQSSVTITFPDTGERQVWVAGGDSPAPVNPVTTKETEVTLPIPAVDPKAMVYALDRSTDNLASIPVSKTKGKWAPKQFDQIGLVNVQVAHGDKPVAAAEVQLQDSKRTQQEFLDPSSGGQVAFYAVAPGTIKVTVKYKSEGKPATPVTQLFTLALKRTEIEPTLTIALPEKVEVVGGSAAPPASATPANISKKESQNPSLIGKAVMYLFALGIAIAAIFFAIQYMKKNQDLVSSKLEQLGVQIPTPSQDDGQPADLPAPPPVTKPEPPQKIVLDDAQPDILGVPAPTPISTAILTGQPRLVAEGGDELPLDEGELTVGRDPGLGLSLMTESTVSRKHAALVRTGDTVVVRDLGSTNGTYVNGVRLNGDRTLKPGDTVQFGAVRFRYEA